MDNKNTFKNNDKNPVLNKEAFDATISTYQECFENELQLPTYPTFSCSPSVVYKLRKYLGDEGNITIEDCHNYIVVLEESLGEIRKSKWYKIGKFLRLISS